MKSGFNEKLFSSNEISGIGAVGTVRLLRGGVARALNFVGRALSYTTARAYGCFLLSFGGVSLLVGMTLDMTFVQNRSGGLLDFLFESEFFGSFFLFSSLFDTLLGGRSGGGFEIFSSKDGSNSDQCRKQCGKKA